VVKYDDTERADKVYNYPYPAIEEALANAVYHRNYELRDPIEVRVLPDSIEIISYSGIDPSLKQSDFEKGVVRTRRYRNRRVGAFLKKLGLTEGKGTGIPIIYKVMKENGSPKPKFDTDDFKRSFFVAEFPIYPNFTEIRDDGSIGGVIGGVIKSTDRQKEILTIIEADNRISYKAIAKHLEINNSAVDKHIKILKEKGLLRRVGGTRGYWEVKLQDSGLLGEEIKPVS
ncbi:winged helix-turn-helix transcriptional regulator, partial [bacterium]|nr:winged helix-turn-helix transcriptional regulator [bacterium]